MYASFDASQPPECSPLYANTDTSFTVNCQMKPGFTNTLQFNFDSFTAAQKNDQILNMRIDNFKNPFSAVQIDTTIVTYSDINCISNGNQQQGTDLEFSSIPFAEGAVTLSSTNNVVGYSGADNELKIQFMPPTALAPDMRGRLQLTMPLWYNIDNFSKTSYMYNEEAIDKCSSAQLGITSSASVGTSLRINYDYVEPGFFSGQTITVTCKGFKNPIYPDFWTGFNLRVFDGDLKQITYTQANTLSFDATELQPVKLDASDFKVQPGVRQVGTFSMWIFNLDVTTPLEESCFIKVRLPTDLEYDF